MSKKLHPSLLAAIFLVFSAVLLHGQTTPEYRAIWVDTWNAGFKSAAQIDQLIADAQRGNLNMIIPQVRRRADAFYDSTIEPKNTGVSPANFDPLAYLLTKAHAASPPIEVHAWIVTYPAGSGTGHPDHVLTNHPDWIMESAGGATEVSNEYWLDPAHPGVQEHILAVALDIITRYDIDGFHFDYIRYPSPDWGYNPVSVQRFNDRYGRSGTPATGDSLWRQFRRDAVTELVRRVYLEAIHVKPDIVISASTIGQGGGITSISQWPNSTPYNARLQDWRGWMEEGILDLNVPMLYYDQDGSFAHGWTNWNIFAKNHKYGRHLAIGAAWYLNSVSNTLGQIDETRQTTAAGHRADGISGYNYSRTTTDNVSRTTFLNTISAAGGPFPQKVPTPTMPWKVSPNRGYAMGIVTASNDGWPFDYAEVKLTGPETRTVRTDGNGFYGVVDLLPGTYTITASMPDLPYDPAVAEISVVAGEVASADLTLEFAPAAEIIIDNPEAEFAGSWVTGSNPSQFGANFRQAWTIDAAGAPTATATFRPIISIPGTYEIYAWYVSASNRASNALYQIVHSGGQETVTVDQRTGGGQWRLLVSDIHFAAGTDGYVRLGNNADGSAVIADAVRFQLIEADPDPADFFEDPIVYAGSDSAIVTWETVGPSVVQVEYGPSRVTTDLTQETTTMTTEHSVTISGLQSANQYQLRLHARAGTKTYSSNWYSYETGSAVEVIVDNEDAGFSKTGSWDTATFGTFYGDNYARSFAGASGATATFRPVLPVSGAYDVYTMYADGAGRAVNVEHRIGHAGGEESVFIDQPTGGGVWRLLLEGRQYHAGNDSFVRITNNGTGVTIADAQRWVLRDSPPEHILTTDIDGSGTVTRNVAAATYPHGAMVQLTAEAADGWVFSHWEGDLEEESESASIRLYRDRQVTAVFHELHTLTTAAIGQGTVELTPDQAEYPEGSEVQALAVPAPGWAFIGWTGDLTDEENPILVWMDGDKTLTANFGFSYEAWSEAAFTEQERNDPAVSGPDADPRGHGIRNLLKYAFGMNFAQPDRSRLPSVEVDNGKLVLHYTRLRYESGLQYQIEFSSNLIDWQPANGVLTETSVVPEPDGRTERVTLESPPNTFEERAFIRLRVE